LSEILEKTIKDRFPDDVIESSELFGVLNLKIRNDSLLPICRVLHEEPSLGFDYLADITSIDWKDRVEVIYRLSNLATNSILALRIDLDRQKPEIDSLCDVWMGANYQEREVYDLMGIVFKGHPELERILLPLDWEGYPLRKDYVIPD
jgi:NADH-quinone oxidoreductase subunit C